MFFDAWKQSGLIDRDVVNTNQRRMAYTFRRAARAIMMTSSTTSVAFFGNAFCKIMPMRAFGIFAGVIVPVNFLLVISFMPPALIWYEEHLANDERCQCWAKAGRCLRNRCSKDSVEVFDASEFEEDERLTWVETIFDEHINNFVERFKWWIIGVSMAWFLIGIYIAAHLGPITHAEHFISPDHPRMVVFTTLQREFPVKPNEKPTVTFMWGTLALDQSKTNFWDREYKGELVFDEEFG